MLFKRKFYFRMAKGYFTSNGVNLCVLKCSSVPNDVNLITKGGLKFKSYPSCFIRCETLYSHRAKPAGFIRTKEKKRFSIKNNNFSLLLNENQFDTLFHMLLMLFAIHKIRSAKMSSCAKLN